MTERFPDTAPQIIHRVYRLDELVMRPSFWQTLHARRRRAKGDRTQVVAHEDVLVFRKPLVGASKASDAPTAKAA